MATTQQGQQLTEDHRRAQALLAAAVLRELTTLWRGFGTGDVEAFWPAMRDAIVRLVQARRVTSSGLSSVYYRQFRAAELGLTAPLPDVVPVPESPIVIPPPLPEQYLGGAVDVAGPVSFKQEIAAGKTPEQARDRALVTEQGAVSRLVLDGGRATIEKTMLADPKALGWARVTDGHPCAFCAMLASRGPVYKSQRSAGDPRGGGQPWHFHCGCAAEPVFHRDTPIPGHGQEFQDLWYESTGDSFGKDKVNAFRRAYEAKFPPT